MWGGARGAVRLRAKKLALRTLFLSYKKGSRKRILMRDFSRTRNDARIFCQALWACGPVERFIDLSHY